MRTKTIAGHILVFYAVLLFSLSIACPARALAKENRPLVVVVTTGGTIAQKEDPKTGALVPAVSGDDLIQAVPGLGKIARIEVREFSNIDSSHMTPEIWSRLSGLVKSILGEPQVTGVVVTHGTDTMAEAAFFLDATLRSEKPVVLVGAMRGASDLSADGPANIHDAVLQAVSPEAKGLGVTVTMNQFAWAARCVEKTRTSTVQTFNCGGKGYLGSVIGGKFTVYNHIPPPKHLAVPDEPAKVVLLTSYAGDDGAMLDAAVNNGARGVVLEALGQGNVNPKVFEAVKRAIAAGVTVIVTSRVLSEPVFGEYGSVGGGASLEESGAILSRELRGPKARLLLMLALPQIKGRESLKRLFE